MTIGKNQRNQQNESLWMSVARALLSMGECRCDEQHGNSQESRNTGRVRRGPLHPVKGGNQGHVMLVATQGSGQLILLETNRRRMINANSAETIQANRRVIMMAMQVRTIFLARQSPSRVGVMDLQDPICYYVHPSEFYLHLHLWKTGNPSAYEWDSH